jgi:probable phosphoglycerate mutase
MTRFLLIRHASHDYLSKGIASWLPGVHLNAQGREEAGMLADALAGTRMDALYSSPLERTMETARVIAARVGIAVEEREAFGEVRFGEWTDASFAELDKDPRWRAYNRFRSGTRAPWGEMMIEVQSRVVVEMERIRAERPEATVAVVSHGDTIKAAVMHYAGIAMDFLQRIEISPASVSVVEIADWGPKLTVLNARPWARDGF